MNNKTKHGCGKDIGKIYCGDFIGKKIYNDFYIGRQSAIKEVLDFINKERDNGNCEGGGFSAGICLSDLIKKLMEDKDE